MKKTFFKEIDFGLIIVPIFIFILGLILIYSATFVDAHSKLGDNFYFLKKQLIWAVISIVFFLIFMYGDYLSFLSIWKIIYGINIVLLALILIIGKTSQGSQRWISIGPFNFQPSEFAKIFIIITLSCFILQNQKKDDEVDLKLYLYSFLHIALPLLLIFKQPDLGTSLTFIAIWLGIIYVAGAKVKHLIVTFFLGISMFPLLWHLLKDYQKKRLLIFLDPTVDPLGAGYHLIQSKIAVGSGGFLGKGLFQGTQSKLSFIPGEHTDFIFSLLAEELGFIGVVIVLSLFFLLLFFLIKNAFYTQDKLGKLLLAGIISMLLFHLLVNVGMTLGVMPITGIPLPFMSYGGSFLMVNVITMGLAQSIYRGIRKIRFK